MIADLYKEAEKLAANSKDRVLEGVINSLEKRHIGGIRNCCCQYCQIVGQIIKVKQSLSNYGWKYGEWMSDGISKTPIREQYRILRNQLMQYR